MKNIKIPLLWLLASVLTLSGASVQNQSVEKVFGSSPPMNYLLYAINPNKMIGLNFSVKNENNSADTHYLKQSFLELPVIGSFHGSGNGMNVETIIKYSPDLILVWEDDYLSTKVTQAIAQTHIPTLTLPFRKIESMADSIQKAADAMGESKRGRDLSSYTKERLGHIKKTIHPLTPVRYYYAEGNDALATECSDSFHVEALNYAGGKNVHNCTQSNLQGLERITFEQLLIYDPDVIVVQNRAVLSAIENNPLFAHLRAVKEKRVYLAPNTPFHWLDRPPSFMRIIGIEWLASKFHPEHYDGDIYKQIAEFFALFLDVKLSKNEIEKILGEK